MSDKTSACDEVREPRVTATATKTEVIKTVTLTMDEETALWLYNLSHGVSLANRKNLFPFPFGDFSSKEIAGEVFDSLSGIFDEFSEQLARHMGEDHEPTLERAGRHLVGRQLRPISYDPTEEELQALVREEELSNLSPGSGRSDSSLNNKGKEMIEEAYELVNNFVTYLKYRATKGVESQYDIYQETPDGPERADDDEICKLLSGFVSRHFAPKHHIDIETKKFSRNKLRTILSDAFAEIEKLDTTVREIVFDSKRRRLIRPMISRQMRRLRRLSLRGKDPQEKQEFKDPQEKQEFFEVTSDSGTYELRLWGADVLFKDNMGDRVHLVGKSH